MIKRHLLLLLLIAILSAVNNTEAGNVRGKDINKHIEQLLVAEHVDNEIIVRFREEIAADDMKMARASAIAHSAAGGVIKKWFRGLKGSQLVSLPAGISLESALRSYLENPDITYAEPNYIVQAALTPDDPDLSRLWALHNTGQTGGTPEADIDAINAWDITTGSPDVVIAVVDSGVALNSNISAGHPELAANLWRNTGETNCTNKIDDDGNGYVDDCYGWDFLDNDNDPMDYNGHGTHVSGTIAAAGNNGTGITGVMWRAGIMPLRFLDAAGSGTTADAVSAILYAGANGAHVINNSWGGSGYSQALSDAISASGAVVVCAAGNSGMDNDATPFYPASYTSGNIISVAATDHNDDLAWFSNYGATSVDIAAPGVSIYSTVPARNQIFFDNMTNLSNWTADTPWGLSSTFYSSPSSASDSPSGNYSNNADTSLKLTSPLVLTGLRGTSMEYILRLETELDHDYLCIDTSTNGRTWINFICWHGSTGGYFYFMEEDFTSFDNAKKLYMRFRLTSNSSVTYDGAYIDDVKITSYSGTYTGTEYAYYQGTSMAAPHVSGVAGLIKSYNPGLASTEIINTILNNVDIKSSLTGKVLSEGRLNAYNALYNAPCPGLPVKILSTGSEFSTLQGAYNNAGSGDIIMSHDTLLAEDLVMDLNKDVSLEGGYDCGFAIQTGNTALNGNITITNGTVSIGGFILE